MLETSYLGKRMEFEGARHESRSECTGVSDILESSRRIYAYKYIDHLFSIILHSKPFNYNSYANGLLCYTVAACHLSA